MDLRGSGCYSDQIKHLSQFAMIVKSRITSIGVKFLVCAALAMLTNCSDDDLTELERFNNETKKIDRYIESNNLSSEVQTDAEYDLRYIVNNEGDGLTPESYDSVDVTYTITLLDTEEVALGDIRDTLKVDNLVTGMRVLIPKVMQGGDITMFIPSIYGNGPFANEYIPANSTLIVDAQVHKVFHLSESEQLEYDQEKILEYLVANDLDASPESSGIYYDIKELGNGEPPLPGDRVVVSYSAYWLHTGELEPYYFGGENYASFLLNDLVDGWQIMLPYLNENGSMTMYLPSVYGYGTEGVEGVIPSNAPLIFDVTLHSVE